VTERTYDSRGYVQTESAQSDDGDEETQIWIHYFRDLFGNITDVAAWDAYGAQRITCTSYDEDAIFPYAHKNPAGHLSFAKYDGLLGVMKAAIDPNELTTQWAHDRFGRVTTELRPDGTQVTQTLTRTKDGGPNVDEWNVKLRVQQAGIRDDTVQYDGLGRAVRSWTQGVQVGNGPVPRILHEVSFEDLGGRVARRSVPTAEPQQPPQSLQFHEETRYDGMGRAVERVSPWGGVTTYQYVGTTVLVTTPGNAVTRIENDALGRPVSIIDPEDGTTSYSYGPFGGLWTVTDPGGAVTSLERDAYGRVKVHTDPDRGKTNAHYNGFGQRTWSVDEANRVVEFQHDLRTSLRTRARPRSRAPRAIPC
jgi:YD repeat-containing protein